MIRNCLVCGKEFTTYPSKIKGGRGKYCSRECSDQVTLIKKGQHLSPETQIKKGEPLPEHIRIRQEGKIPWNDKGLTAAGFGYKTAKTIKSGERRKKEHRLVVERYIGRELHRWEIVHHVNGKKADNRIENLWVFNGHKSHIRHHHGLDYPEEDVIFKGGDA